MEHGYEETPGCMLFFPRIESHPGPFAFLIMSSMVLVF